MANIEDYLPGGPKDPNARGGDALQGNIADAQQQQEERQRDPATGQFVGSTPQQQSTNWEERYKELEKLNSRQAQTVGEYRKIIDEYIVGDSTPQNQPEPQQPPSPITVDELYEDPNAALNRAVDAHPAIQEARKIKEAFEKQQIESAQHSFAERHPDYQTIAATPEFQNWVVGDATRIDLYNRGNKYDFNAADALFRLYKAENGIVAQQRQQEIDTAELVSSSGELVQDPPRYSRSEYIDKLTRAKQGDLQSEDWVKRNAAGYRQALATGNVRD